MSSINELPKDIHFLCEWTHDFDKLLSDRFALKLFAQFLKKEYSYENLKFWLSCKKYKNIVDRQKRIETSKYIYDKYLRFGAEQAVNVDNKALVAVESQLEDPKPDLFKISEKQIYELMKTDCYKRFLKSFYSNNMSESLFREKMFEKHNKSQSNDTEQQGISEKYRKNAYKKLKRLELNEINRKIAKRKILRNLSPKKRLIIKPNGGKQNSLLTPECNPIKCERMERSALMQSIQWIQTNMSASKPKLNNTILSSNEKIRSLIIVFTNGSQEKIDLYTSETLRQLLDRVLKKRNLNFTSFEAYPMGSEKELDLNTDVMDLKCHRIRVEQRVGFEVKLPNGLTISVKSKPSIMSAKVLNPILIEFNHKFDPEYYEIRFTDTWKCLEPDMPIFCADNRKLVVLYQGINECKSIRTESVLQTDFPSIYQKERQHLNEFLGKENEFIRSSKQKNNEFLNISDISFNDDLKSEEFFNDLMKCSQTVPKDAKELTLSPKFDFLNNSKYFDKKDNILENIMFLSEKSNDKNSHKSQPKRPINSPKLKVIDFKKKSPPILKSDQLYDKSLFPIQDQCSDVNPPRGGYTKRECVGVSPGFECSFSCKPGCTLYPPEKIVCQNNVWSPPVPPPNSTCRPNLCPQRSIPNGSTCGPTHGGNTCTFYCNPGYQISGKTTFECVFPINGLNCESYWEASPLPVCTQQLGCPPGLVRPINGYLDGNCQGTLNEECRIVCNQGYILMSNNPTIRCTTNGWSPSVLPVCQQAAVRCPELILRDNLMFVDGVTNINQCRSGTLLSRCEFYCPDGYYPDPNIYYLDCYSSGQWSGELPNCRRACDPVLRPTNGFVDNTCLSPAIGQVCNIGCDYGFILTPDTSIIQCTNIGWNPPITQIPVCQQVRCPELIPMDNLIFSDITINQCRNGSPGSRCQFSCPNGYSLRPNIKTLVCNSNGQWSEPLPRCARTCYPDINQPSNGFTEDVCQSPDVGQQCRIGCSLGYVLTPNTPVIQCTSNGWNPSVIPICQQIRCPELIPSNHLIFSENTINQCINGSPGSRCQFNCATGYYSSSNINYLDCNSDGQWSNSGQLPSCQLIQCNSISVPINGKTSGECIRSVTRLGSVCNIRCFRNCFLSDNTATIDLRCVGQVTYNGWDRQAPDRCLRPQNCEPTTIEFANTCPTTPIGGACTVTCLPGYRRSGNNLLTCVENNQISADEICLMPFWSSLSNPFGQPLCVRVLCPDIIPNPIGSQTGNQGVCANAGFDDVCTWICGPRYRNPLNNGQQMTARCQINGQWDGPTQCVQASCPSLPRPIDGTYTDATCNPGIPGALCLFSCFDRFTLDPPNLNSLYCQDDGTWTYQGIVPRCAPKPDCDNIPVPAYAKTGGHCVSTQDNQLRVGSICTVICFEGCYLSDGSNYTDLTCSNINGITQWDKPIPSTCLQQRQCLPFGPIEFGTSCSLANIGDTCTLTCNDGYNIIGNNVFTCILPSNSNPEVCAIAQWSFPAETGRLPVCLPSGCPELVVANARMSGKCSDATTGQRCTIVCPNGSRTVVTCLPTGQWDNVAACLAVTCPALDPPENGEFTRETCAPGIPEQTCQFVCNEGFILEPPANKELTCQANGEWTLKGKPPTCAKILCPDISKTVITSGGINADPSCVSRVIGAVCNFFCADTYVLNGEASTQCQPDGEWNNVAPTCDLGIIECPGLASVENGIQQGNCNPGRSGERCTYGCNEGFALVGDAEFLCQQNTNWDKSVPPTCQLIVCEDIVAPNTEGVCVSAKTGDKCTVICANGDRIELTCNNEAQWDGEGTCPDIINCSDLKNPENGMTTGTCTPGVATEVCTFSCSEGFQLEGPSELTCGGNGVWSDEPPTCIAPVPRVCPPIHLPTGAKNVKYCSPGRLGKRCEMGCGRGYKMEGKNSMLCTMNGYWIGKTAQCLRQCKPIHGVNGRLSGQCGPTGLQNKYCSLRCNPGYALVGPRSALCASNGIWAPTLPRCLRQVSDCE